MRGGNVKPKVDLGEVLFVLDATVLVAKLLCPGQVESHREAQVCR